MEKFAQPAINEELEPRAALLCSALNLSLSLCVAEKKGKEDKQTSLNIMASSLLQPSSSTISFSSSSSSASYSLFTGSSHTSTLRAQGFDHHSRTRISVKCDMQEALDFGNGKPIIPVLNEQTLPKFLQSARAEKTVNRNCNRLKLFSGSANPRLSQEIARYMGLELGKLSIKRFADGEIYIQLQEC